MIQKQSSLYQLLQTVQKLRINTQNLEHEYKKAVPDHFKQKAIKQLIAINNGIIDECIEDLKRNSTIKIFM